MAKVVVDEELKGTRVDVAVGRKITSLSRNYISRLIDSGKILVNSEPAKAGYKLRAGDILLIDFDEKELDVIPDIDLPVIYEDESVIVVNKPAGVISHSRGKYWDEPSVASFIRQKVRGLQGERAGIVHRLDRATSGVMICAKNEETMKFLQMQFQDRKVVKTYIAVIETAPKELKARIIAPIARNLKNPKMFHVDEDGKLAETDYEIVGTNSDGFTVVELLPKTGRTHQLRVHLNYINRPIVGDELYGGKPYERLLLHAEKLKIALPSGEFKEFAAPLPVEFKVRREV